MRADESFLEARSSMHFCLAVAFLDRKVTAEQFTERKLAAPHVHDLMRRVEMYIHPDLQTKESLAHEFTSVTLCLRGGTEYSVKIEKGQGSVSAPLKGEEVIHKYRDCAQSSLTRENVKRSLDMIQDLENLGDIRELMGILSSSEG
jgi:2-methylcitrate dehydratase PrpD